MNLSNLEYKFNFLNRPIQKNKIYFQVKNNFFKLSLFKIRFYFSK